MSQPKFSIGELHVTPKALSAVPDSELMFALARHETGNWGKVRAADRRANELALIDGTRLLSVYQTKAGVRFWIVTEADRSLTTVLLPEEN
jgi:hypothetical protein